MNFNKENNRTSKLFENITTSALVVGGISFALGFILPLIFSSSNIGPLIGIFVTGPIGALVGVVWGIVKSSKNSNPAEMEKIFKALFVVWVIALLFTLFLIGLNVKTVLFSIFVQVLILSSIAYLLYHSSTQELLSELIVDIREFILLALVIVLLTTIFPPVKKPNWGTESYRSNSDFSQPLPKFAFFLDKRFDASYHYPLFDVNVKFLFTEWILLVVFVYVLFKIFKFI